MPASDDDFDETQHVIDEDALDQASGGDSVKFALLLIAHMAMGAAPEQPQPELFVLLQECGRVAERALASKSENDQPSPS